MDYFNMFWNFHWPLPIRTVSGLSPILYISVKLGDAIID